jgi:hypothetical protein
VHVVPVQATPAPANVNAPLLPLIELTLLGSALGVHWLVAAFHIGTDPFPAPLSVQSLRFAVLNREPFTSKLLAFTAPFTFSAFAHGCTEIHARSIGVLAEETPNPGCWPMELVRLESKQPVE